MQVLQAWVTHSQQGDKVYLCHGSCHQASHLHTDNHPLCTGPFHCAVD
jgi:hypothetical protein